MLFAKTHTSYIHEHSEFVLFIPVPTLPSCVSDLPFTDSDEQSLSRSILNEAVTRIATRSKAGNDLLMALLAKNPLERPKAQEVR